MAESTLKVDLNAGGFPYQKNISAPSSAIKITGTKTYQMFFIVAQKGVLISVTEMNGSTPAYGEVHSGSNTVTVTSGGAKILNVSVQGSQTLFVIFSREDFSAEVISS